MKKFIITESEKNEIREMYGLINEQQTRCDSWKNGTFQQGDGITTPKITIIKTPTLIEGLYEGPDRGGCIQRSQFNDRDTPHQLAGITVFYEAAPYLKQLYSQGVYVKPDMKNIKMERKQNKMFKISIPLIKTTEDKAVTSINERGGMGHTGDLTEISNIENDPNNKLIEKVEVKAGEMTETFICFRNITKYPIKNSTQQQSNQQPVNITAKDLNDLATQIKTQTQNKSFDFDTIDADLDNFTFSIEPGETQVFKLVLTFNTPEDQNNNIFPSYTNVISKNPTYSPKPVLSGDFENGTRRYSIIALYPPK